MLGFSPLSSAPISSSGLASPAAVTGDQTLPLLTQTTSVAAIAQVTGAQTLPLLVTATNNNPVIVGDQTLPLLTQVAEGKAIATARGEIDLPLLTNDAVLVAAELVTGNQTLPLLTQVATVTSGWILPDCGWISLLGDSLDALLRHLPQGVGWLAWRWPGKTAFKFVSALASLFDDAMDKLCAVSRELDPRTTIEMISEWETALSLPDPCLPTATTIEERRRNIWFRLNKKRWSKASDWHQLAAMFGLEIIITPGWWVQKPALYQMCYPKRYDLFPKLGRFRVYIDVKGQDFGGYDYGVDGRGPGYHEFVGVPYGLKAPNLDAFMCLIDRVRPAHVVVLWNLFPGRLPCVPPDGI